MSIKPTSNSLKKFISTKMKMSGPYQALVILNCLQNNGEASLLSIAKDLASRDQDSIDYYVERLKIYPKQVLKEHNIATIQDNKFILIPKFDESDKEELISLCFQKLEVWMTKNSLAKNSEKNAGWGLLRFNLLAKYKKCLLCGIKPTSENDVELDVDHILPRAKGGTDEIENLQILCAQCNRAKQATSSEDFRPILKTGDCLFCDGLESRSFIDSKYFWIIRDNFPVTPLHTLIIPKLHITSPFEMDGKYWDELGRLSRIVKESVIREDPDVKGFNLGFNDGEVAGQTIYHVHFHIIPRRQGDHDSPRGGIRGVIPSKQSY